MAILEIPTDNDGSLSSFDFVIRLDGQDFTLAFQWNSRGEYWAMSIADDQEQDVVLGLPLAVNLDLLRGCVAANRPKGKIVCVPLNSANLTQPDRFGLSKTHILVYVGES